MPLKIKIGTPAPPPPQATIALQARKTLAGNILISDHHKMDIVIIPSEGKITTIPKPYVGDNVYDYQRELMDHLYHGGVVSYESIQGGDRFGMLEGMYPPETEEGVDPVQVALLQIESFIHATAHQDQRAEEYHTDIEDRFTDPTPEDSTALGAIKPEQDDPYGRMAAEIGAYSFAGYGYFY
jgi:hypothetical protein